MKAHARPRILPPVWFLFALIAMTLLHQYLPVAQLLFSPWRYIGFAVMALSLALILWAALLFRRAGTNVVPFSPVTALVNSGPYRFTRNPMYLGLAGVLLGAALLMGSASPFVVIVAFIYVINRNFIAGEEAMLERAFGREYLDYKARVRRWL